MKGKKKIASRFFFGSPRYVNVKKLSPFRLWAFAGDGPHVLGRGNFHPRPHHLGDRGSKGLRRHGRLVVSRLQHLRRHRRVSKGHFFFLAGSASPWGKVFRLPFSFLSHWRSDDQRQVRKETRTDPTWQTLLPTKTNEGHTYKKSTLYFFCRAVIIAICITLHLSFSPAERGN